MLLLVSLLFDGLRTGVTHIIFMFTPIFETVFAFTGDLR